MRRGLAVLLATSAIAWLTPSLFGQYPPYPYAPPAYGPPPMPYGYYPPQMPMPMPAAPKVYVYGPLDPATAPQAPVQMRTLPDAVPAPRTTAKTKAPITRVQAVDQGKKEFTAPMPKSVAPETKKTDPAPAASNSSIFSNIPFFGGCGPDGCDDDFPDTGCLFCAPRDPRRRGHGQFIADVGVKILVPYMSPRQAYTIDTPNQPIANNDFPQAASVGPRASLAYLGHSGWGIRGSYWYLSNSVHQSFSNASPTTLVGTPLTPQFQFTAPSPTLLAGIGADGYNFSQRLNINIADAEILKEWQVMQTTFLLSTGARYARIHQTYGATQSNPGGANGAITVTQDQQDASASNKFEGWGPTVCLELIHAIPRSHFSIYANARGSFIFGNDTFDQSLRNQNKTINVAGVANFVDTTTSSTVTNHREATFGETEFGLQYGGRCGPCYIFVRAGADLQRWWNIGSPTTAGGNISFIGGTARLGISY